MRILLGILLALLSSTSFAAAKMRTFKEPVVVASFETGKGKVKIYSVADIVSDTKDQDAFALELLPYLVHLTARDQMEYCATFAVNAKGQYAARITTNRARAACLITDAVPPGYKDADIDIHTHVEVLRYKPTREDKAFLKNRYGPLDYVKTHAYALSDGDLARPNGYLATSKMLLWFPGGTEKDVEVIWEP